MLRYVHTLPEYKSDAFFTNYIQLFIYKQFIPTCNTINNNKIKYICLFFYQSAYILSYNYSSCLLHFSYSFNKQQKLFRY